MHGTGFRRLCKLPRWHWCVLFHIGLCDYAREWEARILGLRLLAFPWPNSERPRWRYLHRLPLRLWWPLIELETSRHGWCFYFFGHVWRFD